MEAAAQGDSVMDSSEAVLEVEEEKHEEAFETQELQRSLSAIDRQYAAQPNSPRRIHIIGTGSIGKLVAHALRGIPNPPPITLIFHRYKLVKAWQESKKVITIQDEDAKVSRGGFDVELQPEVLRQHGVELDQRKPDAYDLSDQVRPHEGAKLLEEQQRKEDAVAKQSPDDASPKSPTVDYNPTQAYYTDSSRRPQPGDWAISHEPIHNLIVTTKAPVTVGALSAIRHRLSPSSTICFLQNGMGILDAVNSALFPEPSTRPNYVQGILTHGVNVPPEVAARDPFFAVHAGHGTIALGLLPRPEKDGSKDRWPENARYLLRTLTRTPVLAAVPFTPTELHQLQLEKLAVNSILNPLTSLIDARNGNILYNFALTRTMRLMLAETSLIIRSLPELQSIPNINTRFSAARLEKLVVNVANQTKDNVSSMLADVRAGRKTEIEFINGYIVKRGEEVGVKAVVNYAIMQTVIGKSMITQREGRESVPDEGEGLRELGR